MILNRLLHTSSHSSSLLSSHPFPPCKGLLLSSLRGGNTPLLMIHTLDVREGPSQKEKRKKEKNLWLFLSQERSDGRVSMAMLLAGHINGELVSLLWVPKDCEIDKYVRSSSRE